MSQEKTDEKNIDICEEFFKENSEEETDNQEKADETSEKSENDDNEIENENLLNQKEEEISELKDQMRRLAAEFDNYKKRTKKEKERLYISSVADVVSVFLPVMDNVERALQASEGNDESIRDGVLMIHRQIQEVFTKLGVKSIATEGEKFNPVFHEAVMHVEDENYGENEIVEEFLKGYIYKDETVIRHSVVKVAN